MNFAYFACGSLMRSGKGTYKRKSPYVVLEKIPRQRQIDTMDGDMVNCCVVALVTEE